MSKYNHDSITPFPEASVSKKQQVAEMFDRIAFRYDFMNRFLSGRIDLYWRKEAIEELVAMDPKTILDVATGTADVAIMMAAKLHPEKITGIDISRGMLEIGQAKVNKLKLGALIELLPGDSEDLPFPDGHFDAVTAAFGVRNFENLEKGLQEMCRVLKPGGRLVVLEFSKPKKGFFYFFYDIYLRLLAPRIGRLVSKNGEAYAYLNKSVNAFPEGKDFTEILVKTGFINVFCKPLSRGICSVYGGEKGYLNMK